MARWGQLLSLLLVLGSCTAVSKSPLPVQGDGSDSSRAVTPPAVAVLPDLPRTASSETHGRWVVNKYYGVNFAGDSLMLSPPAPGEWAWAIVDLGERLPGYKPSTIYFPAASGWTMIPPMYAWVGVSDYAAGKWVFSYVEGSPGPVDLSSLPATADLVSPATSHAYMVLISDTAVDFGQSVLAPTVTVVEPELGIAVGMNNSLRFGSGGLGDILTYCPGPAEAGGALARAILQGDGSVDWIFYPLYEVTRPLLGCIRFSTAHFADGRLAAAAARSDPSALVRFVEEASLGAGTPTASFSQQIAVGASHLPSNFDDPQFSLAMAGLAPDEQPHLAFIDKNGELQYAFRSAGSWTVTDGGPADAGGYPSAAASPLGMLVVAFRDNSSTPSSLGVCGHPLSDDVGAWTNVRQAFLNPGLGAGGLYSSLYYDSAGSRWNAAHCIEALGSGIHSLGYAVDSGDWLGGLWKNQVVDEGSAGRDVGLYASVGTLSDGAPAVAYYDSTARQLWLAISGVAAGDVGTAPGEGWLRLLIDDGAGTDGAGRFCSLDVFHTPGGGDVIGIAYEALPGGSSVLRLALVR